MTIKPLGDRVLVKIEEADQKTAGGIYIPDTAQEKTQKRGGARRRRRRRDQGQGG